MTRLTLCMIVRDEQRWLAGCLDSVEGVVDAVVVVDTGSVDATREIAAARGARVVEHAWDDDFAAARNAALAHVDAGYVLVLDADERLAAGAGAALRAAVEAGELDCGLLPLHNADRLDAAPAEVLAGARRLGEPVRLGRLLRRTPDLAWEGRVHEHLSAWSARHPVRGPVEAPLIHYGAVPELRRELAKDARNLRLLERRRADEPRSASVAAYLAQEQARAGQLAAARDTAASAWRLARGAQSAGARPDGAQEALVHAGSIHALLELEADAVPSAQAVLDEAARCGIEHPNFDYLAGRAAESRARATRDPARRDAELARAAAGYSQALGQAGRSFATETLNGVTGAESELRLGLALLQRGDADSALERFDAVLARAGDVPAARLGRVEALLARGEAADALDQLQPLLHPKLPDGWLLGAWAAAAFGDVPTATAMLESLDRALEAHAWLAPHRADLAEELRGMLGEARARTA